MAQGQIDQILSAHPEDRRTIFDEAAGINKYKHQKKEALRKLEYTEANLVRITDIIKEVKRQIISLQRQAGKARRYKELFDQLKGIDTRLARHKYDLLQADITGLESQITNFVQQSEAFSSQIAEKEQQIADLRRSLAEIEHAISEAVNRDHELKSESDRHQQRTTTNTERIAELEELIENNHRETAGAEEKIRVQEELLASLNAEFAQIDSSLASEQAKLQAQQDAVRQLDADLSQKNTALTEAKSALVDLENAIAHSRNELAGLNQKKKYDVIRAERLSTERLQLEDQRRALETTAPNNYNDGLAELRGNVGTLRTALTAKQAELSEASLQVSAATQTHQTGMTDASQKSARLDVLRQFFAAPDGRTTLGNILDVEPQYGAAIEAALHHAIHTILADDLNAARQLLASGLQNPSVAAPESQLAAGDASTGDVPQGAMAWASAVARVRDARFEPLVRSLFAA